MLDINFIRSNKETVKKNIRKRGPAYTYTCNYVDELLKLDREWRILKSKVDNLRHERNLLTLEITKLSKHKEDISKLVIKAKDLPNKIKESEEKVHELRRSIDKLLLSIPNMLDMSVPTGKDEGDNKVVKKFGKIG